MKSELVSKRAADLPGNFFAKIEKQILEKKGSNAEVIRLDIGSPDLPPHPEVIEELAKSASIPTNHGYQPHSGPLNLRNAWANHYKDRFGVILDPESQILPLLGSKEGIFHLSMACLDPGDQVLIPDPGYMTYTRGALFSNANTIYFPLAESNKFAPDLNWFTPNILKKTKLLWLNFPNNPTGATIDRKILEDLVSLAQKFGFLIAYDNAYAQIVYDDYKAPSIFEIPGAIDVAVEFNSLSKSHNMPGWRSGVILGNSIVIKTLHKIKSNIDSGGFKPVHDASAAALSISQDWLTQRNLIYKQRQEIVSKTLTKAGIKFLLPRGSIYIWAATPKSTPSTDFCSDVLGKTGISLTPGIIFGKNGEGYFRLALTSSTVEIEEAMHRFEKIF